ncbi:response regulator [Actinopolymorpha alba]|uniref:response regulator n=1 Tax=Actinopolymorpha alba TaxID=533267 RepID=UPI00037C533F|nr:response regulator [Actinopolymorpha alba]
MIRVLVVDDDVIVARVHRGFVEKVPGFSVVGEARTGAEALAAIRRDPPDLILLDIYLPDMSGLDVLVRLREMPRSPFDVLVITAARDVDTVAGALRGGAVSYLVKPFGFAVLRERLEQYAAARQSRESRPSFGADDGGVDNDGGVGQAGIDHAFATSRTSPPRLRPDGPA